MRFFMFLNNIMNAARVSLVVDAPRSPHPSTPRLRQGGAGGLPAQHLEDRFVLHNRHGHVTPPVLCWNGGDPSTYRLRSSLRGERRRLSGDARVAAKKRAGGAVTSRPLAQPRAAAFAKTLDFDLDAGICHACLSFVSLALDEGDPVEIARQIRRMTPNLWDDGLAEPALAAVRRACEFGVPDAEAALALSQKFAHVIGSAGTLAPDGTRARARRRRRRLRVVQSDDAPRRQRPDRLAPNPIAASAESDRTVLTRPPCVHAVAGSKPATHP